MEKLENFDLTGIIIGSVAGIVISLVIGVILFWLTFGTVQAYEGGIYSQGYTEFSFIIAVAVAAAFFGVKQKDTISAGIVGFIIGLLTSLLEGFVLKLLWNPMTVQSIMGYWGNPTVLLIFVGVIVSIGFNLFFQKNKFED